MKRLVVLGLGLCLATACLAKPLPVANGDFEQGLQGWSLYQPNGFAHGAISLETKDVHGGKNAVRIVNESGDKVLVGLVPAKMIALPEDCRTFALTAWMKADVLPQMVELRVAPCGKDGNTLTPWQEHAWRFYRPPLEPHRGQWYQMRCEFGARDDWAGFQLTFWVNGAKADVIIDDLALETVDPETWRVKPVGRRLPDPAPGTALWWERPEVKVYPTEAPPVAKGTGLDLAACGGEYECLQLCLRPDHDLAAVSARFSDLKGPATLPAAALRTNFVGWVDVKAALGGRSLLGPTPDPLLIEPQRTLPAGQTSLLWLTLKVPRGTKPGDYSGALTLTGEGLKATVPLRVHVYGFDLPEQPALRTIARIWQKHDGYEELFLRDLQEHRCAGGWFPSGLKTQAVAGQSTLQVDTSGFKPAVDKYLRPFGFRIFNVPAIFLGDASGFYNKEHKWQGLTIFSPEFNAAFTDYCRQVGDAIRAERLMEQAIWQIWDEPQDQAMWDSCAKLAGLVKQGCPDARIYLTAGVKDALLDQVDIWCLPWPDTYNAEQAAQVLKRGKELFAYENSLYALDVADSSLLLRSYPWRLRKYDVTGVEWWAVSQWKSDPWQTANPYAPQNGGGYFLYPNPERKGAPVDSIRWEMYREGVEDYDLLTMYAREQDRMRQVLRCRDERLSGPAQMQELVGLVAKDVAAVSRDATAADNARRAAAARIEFLRQAPPALVGVVSGKAGPELRVVAAAGVKVTVNGKALPAGTASVPYRPGLKLEASQGKTRKALVL